MVKSKNDLNNCKTYVKIEKLESKVVIVFKKYVTVRNCFTGPSSY